MKLSAIDFLSISLEKVNHHVQVVTDSPANIRGHSQHVCTGATLETILVDFGFPQRLHSGQGRDFESRITKDLCKVAGIGGPQQRHTIRRGMAK